MRLIDADNLKVLVAVEQNGNMASGKLVTELFEDIPTVEAIPISWIEKWLRKDRNADTDTFIDLISDWRKENE